MIEVEQEAFYGDKRDTEIEEPVGTSRQTGVENVKDRGSHYEPDDRMEYFKNDEHNDSPRILMRIMLGFIFSGKTPPSL
jgi:hypothetical protein